MHDEPYIVDKLNEKQLALLFVPDISGFTKFVQETELTHSAHIISELLEVILNNNELDLSISEVEGDAILFYKFGKSPSLEQVAKQSQRMFIEFHKHLKLYERDRICQCGACSTAQGLSLKFIVHYGDVKKIKIKNHSKLLGSDINIVHKLLKNNIRVGEYVLITEKYISYEQNKISTRGLEWVKLHNGLDDYENIGLINYKYFSLTPLLSHVKEPQKREEIRKTNNPISLSIMIDAPLIYVHSIITDVSLKPNWIRGLRMVKFDEQKIVRIGTHHQCIMPFIVLDIEATKSKLSEGTIEYAERVNNMKMLPNMTTYFKLQRKNDERTMLTVEIHFGRLPIIGWLVNIFARLAAKADLQYSLKRIKRYCEKNHNVVEMTY